MTTWNIIEQSITDFRDNHARLISTDDIELFSQSCGSSQAAGRLDRIELATGEIRSISYQAGVRVPIVQEHSVTPHKGCSSRVSDLRCGCKGYFFYLDEVTSNSIVQHQGDFIDITQAQGVPD